MKMMYSLLYIWLISLQSIVALDRSHEIQHHKTKLLMCPCDAHKLCAKSTNAYAVCNCWTRCNEECPYNFDRIDETTEYCNYGDSRNQCTNTIICNADKIKALKAAQKEESSPTKHSNSSHNAFIGNTEADDSGYFKLSIVGFVLWQIASIGLGMLVCGCCQDCAQWQFAQQ